VATYKIDKSHSEVLFQVRHLVTKVRGRFDDFEGTIEFDESNASASSVSVTIQSASVDTNEKDRDTHLRSADFFDVEKFPTLSFASTSVSGSGESYHVVGDLTIHGVTKQVTLPATFLGHAKDPWGNARVGFESEITVNRKDFGLNWYAALEAGGFLVGDDIKITLSAQGIAQ
jgi:polyisoprenoid-binding protein YceI